MVPQVTHLAEPLAKALDLLNVVNLKDLVVALGLEQQRDEHGPVGVRVDAAAGAAAGEGGEEEGRALGGLVGWRGAEIGALLLVGGILVFEGEDVDVGWLHEFFLDAGGGEVDEVAGGFVSWGLLQE